MRRILKDAPAMSFDGSNDVIYTSSNLGVSGTGACSMNVWARIRVIDGSFNVIASYGVPSASPTGYIITIDSSNNIVARLTGTTSTPGVQASRYRGQWAMFTMVSTGSVMFFYIDGQQVGFATVSPTITNGPFAVGADYGAASPEYFGGDIAEAQFWNIALTPQEVRDLAGFINPAGSRQSLVYWKLNDGPGATTAADSSGNAYTGTLSGATNTVFGPCYSRTRVRNVPYSLYINGSTGSRIVLDAAATTNYGTGDFSFGCFINPSRPGTTAAANTIFASYYADVDGQRGMLFRYNASNQLVLALGSSSADITTTDKVSFGQWQHVGVVRSGDTATVYLNGLPTAKVTGMSARNVTSNVQGRLGEEPSGSNYNMNGFLTQPAFFGRALSDAEMLAWARQGIDAISQTSITLRHDFIDAPSTSITDNSGNGHTSTAQSTTWSRVSPTFLRPSLLENPVFNGDLVLYPSFTAATTTAGRWIDGTAAGSTTNDFWNWAVPALGVTAPGSAQFDSSVYNPNSVFGSTRSLKLSTNSSLGAISACNSLSASAPAEARYLTPLLPSTAYVITAMVKTNNCATNSAFIDLREFTGALASVTTTSSNKLSGTNDWTEVSISVTTNSTTRFGLILLRNNVTGNTSDAWFTDIRVRLA